MANFIFKKIFPTRNFLMTLSFALSKKNFSIDAIPNKLLIKFQRILKNLINLVTPKKNLNPLAPWQRKQKKQPRKEKRKQKSSKESSQKEGCEEGR